MSHKKTLRRIKIEDRGTQEEVLNSISIRTIGAQTWKGKAIGPTDRIVPERKTVKLTKTRSLALQTKDGPQSLY